MKNFIWVIGFVILAMGILSFLVWSGSKSALKTASPDDPNRPVLSLAETSFDFGKINVVDIKEHDFTITNLGKSDLVLAKISTSCDCTSAYIIQGGQKSPKFSMAGNIDSWKATVKPGESAVLKTIYEPRIMPVEGKVNRTVSFATNDPSAAEAQVKIQAEVSK
jgi:hypothetical protein